MRVIMAPLLGLAISGAPASAQNASVNLVVGDVCVGGPRWQPTATDSSAIETVPVPDSYRSMFESTEPCVKWAMDVEGIVDWHLRFGSAAGVSAALGYIGADSRSTPAPAGYLRLLRAAFAAAVPDLKRAAALKQPPGLSYSVSYRFMQQSKQVARLNALLRAREDYIFFARHYLGAAEEFADPGLLAKAETFIAAAAAAADFLAPLEDRPPVRRLLYFNLRRYETDDFRARAALLRARISGSAADLGRADIILKSLERPTDKALADLVYSGGDDFCDISDGVSDGVAIEAACRADDDNDQRLSNLVIDRAQYDAVAAALAGRPLDSGYPSWTASAERLLALEALPDRRRCCGRTVDEDRLRLLMTRADLGARAVAQARGATTSSEDNDRRRRAWFETLSVLQRAERLAPPYAAPARFTRIAGQWLSIWKAAPIMFAEGDLRLVLAPGSENQRFAAYLTASLNSLAGTSGGTAPAAFVPSIPVTSP